MGGLAALVACGHAAGPFKGQAAELAADQVIQRIAFGSCAHQDKPQPIWKSIAAAKPDVFLFLGDNIYGDSEDIAVIRRKYDQLNAIPLAPTENK